MESHVDGECPKSLSRRFFLGALGSVFAASALAKVLPNVEEVAPESPDQLIQMFAPKVHRAATITIDSSVERGTREAVEYIAALRGVPVVGKFQGDVVAYCDPNSKEKSF
jgi:hypothetical protein